MEQIEKYDIKTGDLLLFESENYKGFGGWFTFLIQYFTNSVFSHIGMVVKDPTYINVNMKGYYLWHSDWTNYPDPQDGEKKFGIQFTPLNIIIDKTKENNGKIFLRKIHTDKNVFTVENMKEIHENVYKKPYDINLIDWIEALMRKDSHPQKTNRFWCSAFVGYIYTFCKILQQDTDWSILRPCDFSKEYNNFLHFNKGNYLDNSQIEIV